MHTADPEPVLNLDGPVMAVSPPAGVATRRVRAEHREIRAAAALLADAPSVHAARGVGELLTAHVRFEERTLFPLVEQRLSQGALADLGRALAAAEA